MVYNVVSTKLTEEHTKFLEFCNKKGISPFAVMKEVVLKTIEQKAKRIEVGHYEHFFTVVLGSQLAICKSSLE